MLLGTLHSHLCAIRFCLQHEKRLNKGGGSSQIVQVKYSSRVCAAGLYSLQTAFPYHLTDEYYYSSGEKLLAIDEGQDVSMPPGVDQSQARNVTVDDCATLCSLESRCSAFSYNPLNVRSLACSTEPQCHTALSFG